MKQMVKLNDGQVRAICRKLGEDFVGFSFLESGYHTDTFLLKTKGNKYILKVEQKRVTYKVLKGEYEIIKSLKRGLGPKVILFDSSHRIIPTDFIVEEFVEGEHPKLKATNEFIIAMAKWMKRLHSIKSSVAVGWRERSIKSSIEIRDFSLSSAIKKERNDFNKYKYTLPGKLAAELEYLFDCAVALCRKNDILFNKYNNSYSLLHLDNGPGNILIKNNEIRGIDWEFSGYGVPEEDIVSFLSGYNYKMSTRQKRLFLRTYGYQYSKEAEERLKMIQLINIIGVIWDSVWQLDHLIKKDSDAYLRQGRKKGYYLRILRGCEKHLKKFIYETL